MVDWIMKQEPIITPYGTMFQKHGTVDNPLYSVINGFLESRKIYKNKMKSYPKHSELWEFYNLKQSLEKVSNNSIYGALGNSSSLIYNRNVATSITAAGRSFISTAGMFFEQFLGDNVRFDSLNEVLTFINHTVEEKGKRKFKDIDIINIYPNEVDVFEKIILNCGWTALTVKKKMIKAPWIPDFDELDIIWKIISNLPQEELNRLYYKNNIYEFMDNDFIQNLVKKMVCELKTPYLTPDIIPPELKEDLVFFQNLLREYVMNQYQIIDRIPRWQSMIHKVALLSDTDSAFVCLDPWVVYATNCLKGVYIPIMHQFENIGIVKRGDKYKVQLVHHKDKRLDYDFIKDEVIEKAPFMEALIIHPNDNLRYSLINIMTYVVSNLSNEYIENTTRNNNSWSPDKACRMKLKNEFLLKRLLMTDVKKNYAAIQELQEGKRIAQDLNSSLDIKGIEALTKSVRAESTRNELKKILYNNILMAKEIDQVKVIKDLAILDHKIRESLRSGSKEFYKPARVKSISAYENPIRIQGIKAIMTWNSLKESSDPAINLEERNVVDIAKVDINKKNLSHIQEINPKLVDRINQIINTDTYKGSIDAIAIPTNYDVPKWVMDILDYKQIVQDNLNGFPLDAINIKKQDLDGVNYMNLLKL